MTTESKSATIDDYLKRRPEDRRRALEELRAMIRSIVPDAEECISSRIPAFRLNGVVIAGFCATAKGCRYDQTKGSLHFMSDQPLPMALVRKLIKTRIAQTKE